jgi:hypothetical protein
LHSAAPRTTFGENALARHLCKVRGSWRPTLLLRFFTTGPRSGEPAKSRPSGRTRPTENLGAEALPTAEGFTSVIGDGRPCSTGTPKIAARGKAALFPDEGDPAILEVGVPASMMDILYADPIAAGLARSGEIRFDAECGLPELQAEWRNLTKRVIEL